MVKAVFFDVDGTLFSHASKTIPDSAKAALWELSGKGIPCVIATGRHMAELEELAVRDFRFDGYITLNGQLCLDGQGGLLHGEPLPKEDKARLLTLFSEKEIPLMLVEQDRMYINFVNDMVREAQASVSTAVPQVGQYKGAPLYQAIPYVPPGRVEELARLLPGCMVTRWTEYAVDVISKQGGKAAGIKHWLDRMDLDRAEIMAFGDGENDIGMLEFAGIGVAMGNAAPRAKAAADHVTDHIDKDGIAKALRHYRLIE